MLSDLKLSIMENPDFDFIKENISDVDKVRLNGWYSKSAHDTADFDNVLHTFLWCCTEGEYVADTQISELFQKSFDKKADELGLTRDILAGLYYSHSSLFKIMDGNGCVRRNCKDGLFIVFEGLDGSGKSTQIDMLAKKLRQKNGSATSVYCTAEPTNSATGGLIRDTLSNNYKRDPAELAALFLTDRISHNVNPSWGIQKFLSDGIDVICDRYYYSSFAYQGIETDLDWVMNINLQCPQILKPDICIYLDADSKRCKDRVDKERVHLEIFENDVEIMQKIRIQFFEVFKKLNHTENINIFDANRPQSVIADEIFDTVVSLKK